MERRAELFEVPKGDFLFTLEDITYTPEKPRLKAPFTVKGKIELLKLPFVMPIWVVATVTYPERWWEEIIPIIGGPEVSESATVIGGDFEITFRKGFEREGDFGLTVRAYAGPTFSLDKITIPPFPPVATEEMTFMVAGEVPPEEVGFRNFRIISYSKNGGSPVTPPGVLELDIGDRLQIKLGFDHRDLAVTGKIHAAIWQKTFVDPHDEVLNKEKTFSVQASDDWDPYEEGIEIIITSDIAPGTEYGLYAKIMGITGGDIFTDYLENVITIIGPPELGFDLTKPSVSETPVDPGTPIDITCPITSRSTIAADARAKVIIYEGSIAPGHGNKLREYNSGTFHIEPSETKYVVIHHITVEGTIDRRDIKVEVYVNTQLIKESEWDDVFYVERPPEEVVDFDLTRPSVSPTEITPGTPITIQCPVTSACTKEQTATAKVKIYEGSIYPGHGSLITTKTSPAFTIAPGQTYNVIVHHTALAGTIDRRDVEVGIYVGGKLVKESEWDDVYYVTSAPPAQSPVVQTLDAENVTSYGARIGVLLVDTGYVSNVDVYCQFGKTTAYEMGQTPKRRMYSGDEGDIFQWDLSGLEPDTTYHYRATVDPIGTYPPEVTTTYGQDRTFKTEPAGTLEVYRTRYYYNGHYYDYPHTIKVGDTVGVQFNYRNVSGKTLSVYARLVIYSWGYSAGRIATDWEGTMPADDTRAILLRFTADVVSEWTAHLLLEADGQKVLDTTVVIGYSPPF